MRKQSINQIIWIIAALCVAFASGVPSDRAHAQDAEACWFTPVYDTALFAAPVFTATQQSGALQGGQRYAVRAQAPEYLLVGAGADTLGFVKRDQGTLNGTCGMNIPVNSAPLHTHPTLCVLNTPAQPVALFADAALQVQTGATLYANASYAVVQRAGTSIYVYLDEVNGGWIVGDTGTLTGACETLPTEPLVMVGSAVTRPEARLWTAPDVYQGAVLLTATPNTPVTVLSGPVRGPISYSSNVEGDWYEVRWGAITGWVWSERLVILSESPVDMGSAVVQDNTRLWSMPDVNQGQVVAAPAPGSTVNVLAGPAQGPISFGSPLVGDWYLVRWGDVTGWVWSARLVISAGAS